MINIFSGKWNVECGMRNVCCSIISFLLPLSSFLVTSCTDWLDKDPEAIVAEDEAFKNFRNFQGYIEDIYDLVPDKQKANYCTSWNFGDDALHNPEDLCGKFIIMIGPDPLHDGFVDEGLTHITAPERHTDDRENTHAKDELQKRLTVTEPADFV